MSNILNKLKIPTLLGLTIIILGMGAGVVLVLQNQPTSILTKAGADEVPKNIEVTNIEDESVTISWQTTAKVPGFITFGITSADEQTMLDDRDSNTPQPRNTHHVTLKKLSPQTTYQYKIFSGKYSSNQEQITTPSTVSSFNNLNPVISSVLQEGTSTLDGMAYLSISGAKTLSAPIKGHGNFIIPTLKMRTDDLQTIFMPEKDMIAKITVISDSGQATAIFKIDNINQPIGPLKIGQNLDLTITTPTPTPISDLNIYDLDDNGVVNASDHATILNNFGRNPKNKKADINKDGIVNQKDLDLMSQEITRLGQTVPTITPTPR